MIRLGLCCALRAQPIKFRNSTATSLRRLPREERLEKLAGLCLENAEALYRALEFCAAQGIGCFRVNSQILPQKTHPEVGYAIDELPGGERILAAFRRCGRLAKQRSLRICFHPDQFVVLNSPRRDVVEASLRELEYQAEVASWIAADVVNIHAGGAYGDKRAALDELERGLDRLSPVARGRVTLENDDKIYAPGDLLPLCRRAQVPLVYDVHHHRCLPDALSIEEATAEALATWDREPLFHLSSPLTGWQGDRPQRHHDYIDIGDFPPCWRALQATVEVEAKAKEVAVLALRRALAARSVPLWTPAAGVAKRSRGARATSAP